MAEILSEVSLRDFQAQYDVVIDRRLEVTIDGFHESFTKTGALCLAGLTTQLDTPITNHGLRRTVGVTAEGLGMDDPLKAHISAEGSTKPSGFQMALGEVSRSRIGDNLLKLALRGKTLLILCSDLTGPELASQSLKDYDFENNRQRVAFEEEFNNVWTLVRRKNDLPSVSAKASVDRQTPDMAGRKLKSNPLAEQKVFKSVGELWSFVGQGIGNLKPGFKIRPDIIVTSTNISGLPPALKRKHIESFIDMLEAGGYLSRDEAGALIRTNKPYRSTED